MASYWLTSGLYKVWGDYSREAYLVGIVDNAAGLGGFAVCLVAWELGLWRGN